MRLGLGCGNGSRDGLRNRIAQELQFLDRNLRVGVGVDRGDESEQAHLEIDLIGFVSHGLEIGATGPRGYHRRPGKTPGRDGEKIPRRAGSKNGLGGLVGEMGRGRGFVGSKREERVLRGATSDL